MSKRQFKSQASSGRASGAFGGFGTSGFGSTQSSVLSYVQEPPDYSNLVDSNLVVAFKNLSKKDGTTKAKALEDLQESVGPDDVLISDAFLELWACTHLDMYVICLALTVFRPRSSRDCRSITPVVCGSCLTLCTDRCA